MKHRPDGGVIQLVQRCGPVLYPHRWWLLCVFGILAYSLMKWCSGAVPLHPVGKAFEHRGLSAAGFGSGQSQRSMFLQMNMFMRVPPGLLHEPTVTTTTNEVAPPEQCTLCSRCPLVPLMVRVKGLGHRHCPMPLLRRPVHAESRGRPRAGHDGWSLRDARRRRQAIA